VTEWLCRSPTKAENSERRCTREELKAIGKADVEAIFVEKGADFVL
jgi:hypothetical protein